MTPDEMRALAEQCISHPVSRSITDVENAGMAIFDLLDRVKALEEVATRLRFALGDPDGKLTEPQLVRRAHEVHQKAAKWDDWHEAQNSIETEMPQGWRFVLDCSPGDWSLDLVDPDGNHVEFDHDCDSTAQMIRSAIECARGKAAALKADQQKALQELADDSQLVYSAWSR